MELLLIIAKFIPTGFINYPSIRNKTFKNAKFRIQDIRNEITKND
jgi:hypothetical protein